jgi:hypothetical protein
LGLRMLMRKRIRLVLVFPCMNTGALYSLGDVSLYVKRKSPIPCLTEHGHAIPLQ